MREISLLVHALSNPSYREDPLLFNSVLPSKSLPTSRPMADSMYPDTSGLSGTQNPVSQNAPDQTQASALLDSIESLREARSRFSKLTDDSTREDRVKKEQEYLENISLFLTQLPDQSQQDLSKIGDDDELLPFFRAAAIYDAYGKVGDPEIRPTHKDGRISVRNLPSSPDPSETTRSKGSESSA